MTEEQCLGLASVCYTGYIMTAHYMFTLLEAISCLLHLPCIPKAFNRNSARGLDTLSSPKPLARPVEAPSGLHING